MGLRIRGHGLALEKRVGVGSSFRQKKAWAKIFRENTFSLFWGKGECTLEKLCKISCVIYFTLKISCFNLSYRG